MDEYTFILAAKLEADRRRLEREESAVAPRATPPQSQVPVALRQVVEDRAVQHAFQTGRHLRRDGKSAFRRQIAAADEFWTGHGPVAISWIRCDSGCQAEVA